VVAKKSKMGAHIQSFLYAKV